jgi:hypothetical protein
MDLAKHLGIRKLFSNNILRHIDPFLDNDHKTNNGTTATAMQQVCKYTIVLELLLGSGPCTIMVVLMEAVFCMNLLRSYIT